MVGISIRNVTKRFGEAVAVDHVSLDIKEGELFFLLGPSGCGKTTILRMIAGFERPDGGDIRFDDRSVLDVPPNQRNTGLVFQSYALWPHMTVSQNVAYGLDERKIPRPEKAERVAQALKNVHMEDYGKRMSNELSGGQQQRVALARAMVFEPDVVLLDEPLSNLDARLRLQMRQEIRRIHDETGMTMVYVTHDQKESLSMADTIAVMSMGHVEQMGSPRAIYRSPVNRFVADFVGETNLIPGTLDASDGKWGTVSTVLGTFRASLGEKPVAQGEPVLCMVRPESLTVDAEAGDNQLRGVIKRTVYLGELEQVDVDAGGLMIQAIRANPGEHPRKIGAEAILNFGAEDAVILKA